MMKQEIVVAKPPIYDLIAERFDIEGKPVIFSWGSRIYNPTGFTISNALLAHEAVHGERQTDEDIDIRAWWYEYLAEPEYRLAEELPAHIAEYRYLCDAEPDRNRRAQYLSAIAHRLSSPLYGNIVSYPTAMKAVRKA